MRALIPLFLFITQKLVETSLNVKNLVILHDSDNLAETHSVLLETLKHASQNDFESINLGSNPISLISFGLLKYRSLAIIATTNKKWGISIPDILKYVDLGGNLLVITDVHADRDLSALASELGFNVGKNREYIDHRHALEVGSDIVLLEGNHSCKSHGFFPTQPNPFIFKGRGLGLDPSNPMTFPILHGSLDSYLYSKSNKITNAPLAMGTDVVLVGGAELRNLARAVITDSIEVFSDKFLFSTIPPRFPSSNASSSGNLQMMIRSIEWVLQRRGVLRIRDPIHILAESKKPLDEYIVDQLLEYSVTIEEQDEDGSWKPFVAKGIQLEIKRLTTFGRVFYNVSQNGRYTAQFFAPDYIGIYGLYTRFRSLGYTTLDHQVKIIIRPRRHNDYDRFIFGAYPYYATSFAMIILAFVLVIGLLNQKQPKLKTN